MHVSSTAPLAPTSVRDGHAARPPRSPARLAAEALWALAWHSGQGVLTGARRVRFARMVARERAALARLSPDELVDLGIEHDVARRECTRGWFDLPRNRPGS